MIVQLRVLITLTLFYITNSKIWNIIFTVLASSSDELAKGNSLRIKWSFPLLLSKKSNFFLFKGDQGDSGVRRMKDAERIPFQRSATDVFIMSTSNSLGNVGYLRIWHDNSGGDWYIR